MLTAFSQRGQRLSSGHSSPGTGGTEDAFSLSGYSHRGVFLSDASVTVAVAGRSGQRVMAGSLT